MEKTGRLRRKRIVLFLVFLLAIEIGRIEDEEENEDEIVATRDDFGSSQCTTPGLRRAYSLSKGKITFQSFFMLITVQPFLNVNRR